MHSSSNMRNKQMVINTCKIFTLFQRVKGGGGGGVPFVTDAIAIIANLTSKPVLSERPCYHKKILSSVRLIASTHLVEPCLIEGKMDDLSKISIKFVPTSPIDNNPALI